jgi:arginase family enzyme
MLILKKKGDDVSSCDSIIAHLRDFPMNESGVAPKIELGIAGASIGDGRVCLLDADDESVYAAFSSFAKRNPGAGIIIVTARPSCVEGAGFAKRLIGEEELERNRVILFGLHCWSGEGREFIESNRIRTFTMRQIVMNSLSDVLDGVTETLSEWPALYLHVDLGAADPSSAPAVSSDPGGFTSRELISVMQRMKLLKNLKMLSMTGFDQSKDAGSVTSRLAAKILVELA